MKILNSFVILVNLLLSMKSFAQVSPVDHATHGSIETPAVHGMVLFGSDQLYASHIPMYMQPHNWQALLAIQLTHPKVDVKAQYLNLKEGDQKLFTLKPKAFLLGKLLSGKLSRFQADLYLGSFEDGGTLVLSNITVKVIQVMAKDQLSEDRKPAPNLQYKWLESSAGSYLVHTITAPDNFDQIVQIKWLNTSKVQPALFTFDAPDVWGQKLSAGALYTIGIDGIILPAKTILEADFKVTAEFYCTEGPDFFKPCVTAQPSL